MVNNRQSWFLIVPFQMIWLNANVALRALTFLTGGGVRDFHFVQLLYVIVWCTEGLRVYPRQTCRGRRLGFLSCLQSYAMPYPVSCQSSWGFSGLSSGLGCTWSGGAAARAPLILYGGARALWMHNSCGLDVRVNVALARKFTFDQICPVSRRRPGSNSHQLTKASCYRPLDHRLSHSATRPCLIEIITLLILIDRSV